MDMKLKIVHDSNRPPGGCLYSYVPACAWPRSRYQHPGNNHIGGGADNKQCKADIAEVRAYLASHLNATTNDVAMCCFMSVDHARRLMNEDRKRA